ncbi:MAG: nuclear transport factor 2 family protein [Pseudomonadota bacterium]|nr:nuclear transport factor 2 family protein [Pseudomonadota bacterium]
MATELSGTVKAYFDAERRDDIDARAACFADNGVVRDENKSIEGRTAIKEWMADAKRKYAYTAEPLKTQTRDDGAVIVTAKVAGTFPNSPITLDYAFTLEGGKIAALEIG